MEYSKSFTTSAPTTEVKTTVTATTDTPYVTSKSTTTPYEPTFGEKASEWGQQAKEKASDVTQDVSYRIRSRDSPTPGSDARPGAGRGRSTDI